MATVAVKFSGFNGNQLAGRIDMPLGTPRAYALFAHGFTLGKDFSAASRISSALAKRGIAVLRFDFSGLGKSEGDFADTNFSSNVQDLLCAAAFLRSSYQAPSLIVGHSLGGAAVLTMAGEVPECKAVVSIAAPSEPRHVEHQFSSVLDDIHQHGQAEVKLGGRPFQITRQFLEDLDAIDISHEVATLGRALLVMHSPVDATVSVDNARIIYESAKHPKSYVSLDQANHLLLKREDAEYAAHVLAAWAEHYLPPTTPDTTGKGIVEVESAGRGKFDTVVHTGKHLSLVDEPKELGGTDRGASPYDYLLASLGSCTAMTLRMYARRKKIPLKDAKVRLSQQRVHAEDCADCDVESGSITKIERDITLIGNLTDEQKNRLLDIADRCPVHLTLMGQIQVNTQLTS